MKLHPRLMGGGGGGGDFIMQKPKKYSNLMKDIIKCMHEEAMDIYTYIYLIYPYTFKA